MQELTLIFFMLLKSKFVESFSLKSLFISLNSHHHYPSLDYHHLSPKGLEWPSDFFFTHIALSPPPIHSIYSNHDYVKNNVNLILLLSYLSSPFYSYPPIKGKKSYSMTSKRLSFHFNSPRPSSFLVIVRSQLTCHFLQEACPISLCTYIVCAPTALCTPLTPPSVFVSLPTRA